MTTKESAPKIPTEIPAEVGVTESRDRPHPLHPLLGVSLAVGMVGLTTMACSIDTQDFINRASLAALSAGVVTVLTGIWSWEFRQEDSPYPMLRLLPGVAGVATFTAVALAGPEVGTVVAVSGSLFLSLFLVNETVVAVNKLSDKLSGKDE